jgi:hypothetical protein
MIAGAMRFGSQQPHTFVSMVVSLFLRGSHLACTAQVFRMPPAIRSAFCK